MQTRPLTIVLGSLFLLFAAAISAPAADYYLDPVNGQSGNPGTSAAPFGSLESVAASGRTFSPGDTLILRSGYHGSPTIRGQNSGTVTIRPDTGARPTLKRLVLQNATRWTIRGLEISPSFAPTFERLGMVSIAGGSDNVLEDCRLFTIADASAWTATDWDTKACNGVNVSGTRNIVRRNHLLNVNFGIDAGNTARECVIAHNVVENFSGDGLRGLGDYCVFEYNEVKNCYKVNTNHDDAFQSWSTGSSGPGTGVVRGVVVRGNRFVVYEDSNQPMRGSLQGIGCFDGFFEDWVVENNVIITNAWHGIAFYGARNCRIVNNTVIDRDSAGGVPWIKITAHKDGTASTGNLVRNNLTSDLRIDAGMATVDHNLESTDYARHFVNWSALDLRLAATSPAIDAGVGTTAPTVDILQSARPIDGNGDGTAAWDLGAYEFGIATVPAAPSGASVTGGQ